MGGIRGIEFRLHLSQILANCVIHPICLWSAKTRSRWLWPLLQWETEDDYPLKLNSKPPGATRSHQEQRRAPPKSDPRPGTPQIPQFYSAVQDGLAHEPPGQLKAARLFSSFPSALLLLLPPSRALSLQVSTASGLSLCSESVDSFCFRFCFCSSCPCT